MHLYDHYAYPETQASLNISKTYMHPGEHILSLKFEHRKIESS